MIRDLTELSKNMVQQEEIRRVQEKAAENAEERLLELLLPPMPPPGGGRCPRSGVIRTATPAVLQDAREVPPVPARRQTRRPGRRTGDAGRQRLPDDRGGVRLRPGGHGHPHQGHAGQPVPAAQETAQGQGARRLQHPHAGRGAAPGRHGRRGQGGGAAASSSPASSSWTNWTRSPGANAAAAPTCRARACSATCCRSSRAAR